MHEQTRSSIGKTESREIKASLCKGACTPKSFIGRGSPAKMAAQARRTSMKFPPSITGACWIPLSGGMFALVDESDATRVNEKFWTGFANKKNNVRYALFREHPSKKTVFLHNWLLDVPPGKVVDHANGNGLDCRRVNMRICSPTENRRNLSKWKCTTSSQFKGVHFAPRYRMQWAAAISVNHRTIHIGRFPTEIAAAKAYDTEATKRFGKFAKLNFPCG